jgi:hypothetical protein
MIFIQNTPSGRIDPRNEWKLRWDAFVSVLIIYSVISVPFYIAFNTDATGGLLVWEYILDISFGIDIIFTFFTGYYSSKGTGDIQYALRKIAWKYVTGSFLIDFISTFPWDLVLEEFVDPDLLQGKFIYIISHIYNNNNNKHIFI